MLKNISRLEAKIGEKIYHFTCDMDSTLTDVKLALHEFFKYVENIEEQVKLQQEKAKEEEETKPEVAI